MIRQLERDGASSSLASLVDVTYRYPDATVPSIDHCSWEIGAGEMLLVAGASGSGKSTLLRTLNGLVPHFSGGRFGGSVVVCGDSTRANGPNRMSRHVGFVFQDPEAQVLGSRVDEDIAFALEQRGVPRTAMRKRVEELLDLLAIAPLRHRDPRTLSGGERQRVAIAGALALHPQLLVLDEPTSQLDPWGAEDVLASLSRLNEDLGLTIVIAEHRMERLLHRVDAVRWVEPGGARGVDLAPRDFARTVEPIVLPAVSRLGVGFGWQPVPLTVKEARRHAARVSLPSSRPIRRSAPGGVVMRTRGIGMRHGSRWILRGVDLDLRQGELVALIGRNGSGKTTLLRTLLGHHPLGEGAVEIMGLVPGTKDPAGIGRSVGYLPQQPTAMLFAERVRDEILYTARQRGVEVDPDVMLAMVGLDGLGDRHPRDLSGGEQERLALAIMLTGKPCALLLDEPTRGMDAWRKDQLIRILDDYRRDGGAVLMATHDVELIAGSADRVVMLGDGEVIADGPPEHVLGGSLTFTTQTQLVFGDEWLTPGQVLDAVRSRATTSPATWLETSAGDDVRCSDRE